MVSFRLEHAAGQDIDLSTTVWSDQSHRWEILFRKKLIEHVRPGKCHSDSDWQLCTCLIELRSLPPLRVPAKADWGMPESSQPTYFLASIKHRGTRFLELESGNVVAVNLKEETLVNPPYNSESSGKHNPTVNIKQARVKRSVKLDQEQSLNLKHHNIERHYPRLGVDTCQTSRLVRLSFQANHHLPSVSETTPRCS